MTIPLMIDGDGHVIEREGMWLEYLEPEFHDRSFRRVRDDYGRSVLMVDDELLPVGVTTAPAKDASPSVNANMTRPGGYDPVVRLRDMGAWRAQRLVAKLPYDKPSITGMYFLGIQYVGSTTAASNYDPNTLGAINDPELNKLGKAWAEAATLDEYAQRAHAYNRAVYDKVYEIYAFVSGETWGAGSKIPQQWNQGRSPYSFNYEHMAALWF